MDMKETEQAAPAGIQIKLAEHAGLCFGSKRAVDEVMRLLDEGKSICTYGPILHNEHLVEELSDRGVTVINSEEELERLPRDTVLVIRAHGITKQQYEKIEKLGIRYYDATCPFVKRIHRIVRDESRTGKVIVIAGDSKHPEVQGIESFAESKCFILKDTEDARLAEMPKDAKICVVVQTTFRENIFKEIVEILKDRGYNVNVVNTICNATEERQTEAARIASESDAMVVIGGLSSSNTRKLFDICRDRCKATFYVQDVRDMPDTFPEEVRVVGITAGASTPKNIIEEVCNYVRGIF